MNKVKNSIGWADYTWNPVTGCKRDCSYCYAKQIHNRFYKNSINFSEIAFHSERLIEPSKIKKPSRIFVGSVSDIEYWQPEHILRIIGVCCRNPQHTFMFLTKGIRPYNGYKFPDNCILGITETGIIGEPDRAMGFLCGHKRGFISMEPLLGFCPQSRLVYSSPHIEKVIVGAMSGPGAVIPKREWINSVLNNVPFHKIYWKRNIWKYLNLLLENKESEILNA